MYKRYSFLLAQAIIYRSPKIYSALPSVACDVALSVLLQSGLMAIVNAYLFGIDLEEAIDKKWINNEK